jgi:hypothetical protein
MQSLFTWLCTYFLIGKSIVAINLACATTAALSVMNQNEDLPDSHPFLTSIHADEGRLEVHDRRIVIFTQTQPGLIHVAMRDIEAKRDQNLSFDTQSEAELAAGIESWKSNIEWWKGRLTVYRLQPEHHYKVHQSFIDSRHNEFSSGTQLTFEKLVFVPYDGEYSLKFQQGTVYIHESAEINANFDLYFEEINE